MATRAEHLTTDELEALARGEEAGSNAEQHLEACAPCREAAREGMFATRFLRPLAGDHPDEHVLTALWSNALAPGRNGEVERHVASCSRCRTLLARLVRATPAETSPSLIGDWWLDRAKAWAATSTIPRLATLVVREVGHSEPLQASFVSMTESLRLVGLKAMSREAPAVVDGQRAFRFEVSRKGAATCLVVLYVKAQPSMTSIAVDVTVVSATGSPQRAELRPGSEAVFELSPGTSRLVIGARPRWEIDVRFDA